MKKADQVRIEEILRHWFGMLMDDAVFPEERARLWFHGGPEFDRLIARKFENDLIAAKAGKLDSWKVSRYGCLALILVLDQFSRHIYRGFPESFAQDAKALSICLGGIDREFDRASRPVERIFFYMPLMHSEDLSVQEKSVKMYTEVVEESSLAIETHTSRAKRFAERHYETIKRFGRFPYRNDILGRITSPAEKEFLKDPDYWF